MELYQLKSFVVVAEEAHLTRASERLHASQPTVSSHIKALEDELGVCLFNRTRKGMELTREGEILLEKAERILADTRAFLNQAKRFKGELAGQVKIGLNSNPTLLKITELFAAIMKSYPRLELHLMQSLSVRVLKYIKNEQLDAGFYLGVVPEEQVKTLPLTTINLVVTGPVCLKNKIESADLRDLAEMPWIWRTSCGPFMRFEDSLFCNACFKKTKVIVAEDDETMRSLLIAGAGLQLMEENEARSDAAQGKVAVWPGDKISAQLSFIYLARREDDPAIRALCEVLRNIWELSN